MRTLYIECKMGAAGDMLTAALLELLPDPQIFLDKINGAGIPGVTVEAEPAVKCGIRGTHMAVRVNGMEEHEYFHSLKHSHAHHHHEHAHKHPHEHNHSHEHSHEHTHPGHLHEHGHSHSHTDEAHEHEHPHVVHVGMHEITHILADLNVSDKVRADVRAVYDLIAEAESHVHGVPVEEIHFHEVGALDAVADITGVCLMMELLAPEKVYVSPVHVGGGHIHCTHGIIPVPSPAAAYLLQGIPTWSSDIQGELCTPTGAALLKHFADAFVEMPPMRVSAIGYGMGFKEFAQANCVRAMLGKMNPAIVAASAVEAEKNAALEAVELHCNLDDMTPEDIGFAMERLLENGALDVWTEAIGMKKNRPGVKLCCLCPAEQQETFGQLMLLHTSSIGIRIFPCRRIRMNREQVLRDTPHGPVQFKHSTGYGVTKEKPEYDDLAKIAVEKGLSLAQVREQLKDENEM